MLNIIYADKRDFGTLKQSILICRKVYFIQKIFTYCQENFRGMRGLMFSTATSLLCFKNLFLLLV